MEAINTSKHITGCYARECNVEAINTSKHITGCYAMRCKMKVMNTSKHIIGCYTMECKRKAIKTSKSSCYLHPTTVTIGPKIMIVMIALIMIRGRRNGLSALPPAKDHITVVCICTS